MAKRCWTSLLLLAALGCDRREPVASQPVPATFPAVAPAATKPAKAIFFIDDQPINFPAAKAVFEPRDGDMRVVLMSDDPPAAVRDQYVGNSFYFDLVLERTSLEEMEGATFAYTDSAQAEGRGERGDTSTGLFIDNGRQTLTPQSAKITFEKDDQAWAVRVSGTFQLFDARHPDMPPRPLPVNALLLPIVTVK